MPEEGWQLDSGFRESMDLTIHAAYFKTHAEYQNGQQYLLFLIGSDELGEPQELRMSVGADWRSNDGGATISHPTKKKVSKNSIYGHFIEAAWECPEVVNGQRLRDVLSQRGDAWQAAVWQDLALHLEQREIRFGKNIDPMDRLLPVAYLGISTEAVSQSPSAPATVEPSPSDAVAQARAEAARANGATPLYQEMLDLARGSGSYLEFRKAAFARPEVLADDALAEQVADQQGGIWSLVQAK